MSLQDNITLIQDIHNIAVQFEDTPELLWVPSHVGIEGNELADSTAKRALTKDSTDVQQVDLI